jgi:hypothetical protein
MGSLNNTLYARWPGAVERTQRALRVIGPMLLFGLRLWEAVCLAIYVTF